MATKNTFQNVLNMISKILTVMLFVFTGIIMVFTILSVTTLDKNDRDIFGYKSYIVQTDSMSESELNAHLEVHFDAGDIILVKETKKPAELKAGDIISFMSTNQESYGETVTHMIREVKTDKDGGLIGFVTYGTNTDTNDEALVKPEYVLGVYAGKLPGVGTFFAFLKSTPGYIWCILVPFLILIGMNGMDVIQLFKKLKKEQNAVLEAEKAEIAAERKRNEEMLRELMALKEQLEIKTNSNTDTQKDSSSEETESN